MMDVQISPAEERFIVNGIKRNIRNDGRQRLDVCSFSMKLNTLPYCISSAEICLHDTKVVVGIKLAVSNPDPEIPNKGIIECSVRCSPMMNPSTKRKDLESLDFDLSRELQNIMGNENNGIDLEDLCIIKGHLCWLLHINAVVLQNNGNMFDTICLATVCALKQFRLPNIILKNSKTIGNTSNTKESNERLDEMQKQFPFSFIEDRDLFKMSEVSKNAMQIRKQRDTFMMKLETDVPFDSNENPYLSETSEQISLPAHQSLIAVAKELPDIEYIINNYLVDWDGNQSIKGIKCLPIVITMAIIDDEYFIADPVLNEELCSDLMIRFAVYPENGSISIMKHGNLSILPSLIFQMLEVGVQCGQQWMEKLQISFDECNEIKSVECKTDDESVFCSFTEFNFDSKTKNNYRSVSQKQLNLLLENLKLNVNQNVSGKDDSSMMDVSNEKVSEDSANEFLEDDTDEEEDESTNDSDMDVIKDMENEKQITPGEMILVD